MSDRYFLDTNIFVYLFDESQPEKKSRAMALVSDALESGDGIISWQVIQEFLNVSTRKFSVPLKPGDAKEYLLKLMNPLCQVLPSSDLFQSALDINQQTNYSFYDSLIIASALQAGCKVLFSEDMQSGQVIEDLEIINPFN